MQHDRFRLGHSAPLDGLRGFAVICVMIFHAHTGYLEGGGLGVEIFFTLSGFLITSLICAEWDRHGNISLKNFYARRALRLMPALLLLVFVFAVGSVLLLKGGEAKRNLTEAAISVTYMTNWARAYWWYPPNLLGHTWSLSIEEQFYLIWPLILLFLLKVLPSRRHVAFAALGLAVASLVWRNVLLSRGAGAERLFNGLDTRSDALMVGCALALFFSSHSLDGLRRWTAKPLAVAGPLALAFIAGLMWVSGKEEWKEPYMHQWGFAAVELCAVVLMAHLLVNDRSLIAKGFSASWLRWFGSISYGLYLWHYPVYRLLRASDMPAPIIVTAGSIITILIALASFHLLEKPVLRFKHRFERDKPTTPVASPMPAASATLASP